MSALIELPAGWQWLYPGESLVKQTGRSRLIVAVGLDGKRWITTINNRPVYNLAGTKVAEYRLFTHAIAALEKRHTQRVTFGLVRCAEAILSTLGAIPEHDTEDTEELYVQTIG